jgi:hypothetical protein
VVCWEEGLLSASRRLLRRLINQGSLPDEPRTAMTAHGAPVPSPSVALRDSVPEVVLAMRGLVPSAEPPVVLSSLARSCVPSFSDGCSVELSEGTDPLFRVSYPPQEEDGPAGGPWPCSDETGAEPAAGSVVTTSFEVRASSGWPSYAGVIAHIWHSHVPAQSDSIIARLLVDRAIALVEHQRLAEGATSADERSAQLALETMTARAIGEGTGIIMATRRMTSADALDALKKIGRSEGRNVYEIALEVVRTGALRSRPDRAAQMRDPSGWRGNLRPVREGELPAPETLTRRVAISGAAGGTPGPTLWRGLRELVRVLPSRPPQSGMRIRVRPPPPASTRLWAAAISARGRIAPTRTDSAPAAAAAVRSRAACCFA